MTDSDAAANARPFLRVGWLAKGLVFVIIGVLALELTRRGYGAQSADQQGALAEIASSSPLGRVAVVVVSLGLLGYAAWQVWAAVVQGPDDEVDAAALLHTAKRIGWVGLGVVYALLAVTGIEIGLRGSQDVQSSSDESATSPPAVADRVLDLPAGWILVVAIGAVTIGVGLYQLQKGLRGGFLDDIDTSGLGPLHRRVLAALGGAGFLARALLMGVAGWLFVDAARNRNADRAAGIDQSLRALADAPAGQAILTLCAAGLVCAGLYDMATFRRQRITEAA